MAPAAAADEPRGARSSLTHAATRLLSSRPVLGVQMLRHVEAVQEQGGYANAMLFMLAPSSVRLVRSGKH